MSEQLYRWVKASERKPTESCQLFIRNGNLIGSCAYDPDIEETDSVFDEGDEWLEPLPPNTVAENEKEMKRLYDWIMDENRKGATTFFTSGWLRNVAKEIEFRIASRPSIDIVDELRKMNPYSTNYQEVGFHTGYDAAVVRLQELLKQNQSK